VSIFDDNDLSISLSRVGGPILLFVCSPAMAWIFWKVVQKDMANGIDVSNKTISGMIIFVCLEAIAGIWMCRKGYGWFKNVKGKK
jgi:hypothetical protein